MLSNTLRALGRIDAYEVCLWCNARGSLSSLANIERISGLQAERFPDPPDGRSHILAQIRRRDRVQYFPPIVSRGNERAAQVTVEVDGFQEL
jgi:hypothetical protein